MSHPDLQDAVLSLFHGVDALDWAAVRAAMADTLTTDYTSLFGGEPVTQPADALVATWKGLLPGFEATQHLLGPLKVASTPEGAQVTCQVRGYHRLDGATWMVAGRYDMRWARAGEAWKLTHLTLVASYQDGDPGLVASALQRASTQPRLPG